MIKSPAASGPPPAGSVAQPNTRAAGTAIANGTACRSSITAQRYVGLQYPAALGVEGSGSVLAVGADVTDISVGDEVLAHEAPFRREAGFGPNER
jgi:NADPH:quinone reductase-like Zn-dependent oxidoreductase